MPARTLRVYLVNLTAFRLKRVEHKLDHGAWTPGGWEPPQFIEPNGKIFSPVGWQSESDGFLTGTEGKITYEIEEESSCKPRDEKGNAPLPDRIHIHWDNPFVGSCTEIKGYIQTYQFDQAGGYAEGNSEDFRLNGGGPLQQNSFSEPISTDGWLEIIPGLIALPIPTKIIAHAWAAYALELTPLGKNRCRISTRQFFRNMNLDAELVVSQAIIDG